MIHFIELTQKINAAHGKRTIFVAIENIDFFYDEHIVYSNRAIDVYESSSEIKDKIDKLQAKGE